MSRSTSLTFITLLFGAVACRGSESAAPPPGSSKAPPSISSAVAVTPAPPDPFARIRARGTLIAEPTLHADHTGVAYFGHDGIVIAAWIADATGGLSPWREFPVGVKIREEVSLDAGSRAMILESVAMLDQPGGMIGVARDFGNANALDDALAFRDAKDAAAVKKVAVARAAAPALFPAKEAFVTKASQSLESLRAAISSDGLDVYAIHQGVFVESTRHLDAAAIKDDAFGNVVLDWLRARASESEYSCGDVTCTDDAASGIVFVPDGAGFKLRGVFGWAFQSPSASALKATDKKVIPPATGATLADAVLPLLTDTGAHVLAAAPLHDGQGVAALVQSPDGTGLLFAEGDYQRLCLDPYFGCGSDTVYQVRFLDADDDGRTDLLVFAQGKACSAGFRTLYRAPASVDSNSGTDPSVELLLLRATNLDDATKALSSYVPANVTRKEACAVLAKTKTAKGFRSVSTDDARFLWFEEPGRPMWNPKIVERADVKDGDVGAAQTDCKRLACLGSYCVDYDASPGPDSRHYWFKRVGSSLLVAGMATYGGV